MIRRLGLLMPFATLLCAVWGTSASAQPGPGGPPAVGVVKVEKRPIVETNEFVGRVQAINRVDLVARVTGFLEERLFTEGREVKAGDLLYRLERPPFEADVQAKTASVAQANAVLQNATITLGRAQSLLNTPAGQRSTVDDATASQRSQAALLLAAQAQLRTSQINLAYTEIRAPIDGKIGRTAITEGNVVSPTSGVLATIVSVDPMYVTFPIAVRSALDLRDRYTDRGGLNGVVIKLRLPNGRVFGQDGKLDYIDPTVAANTDTLTLRGRIPNPLRPGVAAGDPGDRELVDGMFVTVILQGVEPVEALAIPRSAILSDQQGNYVFIVDAQSRAQQRRVQLGQSTPTVATILSGLQEGELVITDGIQRARAGQPVQAGPATPGPTAPSQAGAPAAPASGAAPGTSTAASGSTASPPGGAAASPSGSASSSGRN